MRERLSRGMRRHERKELALLRREKGDHLPRRQLGFHASVLKESSSSVSIKPADWCEVGKKICPDFRSVYGILDGCYYCPAYSRMTK